VSGQKPPPGDNHGAYLLGFAFGVLRSVLSYGHGAATTDDNAPRVVAWQSGPKSAGLMAGRAHKTGAHSSPAFSWCGHAKHEETTLSLSKRKSEMC